MKKFTSISLALTMIFLAACSSQTPEETTTETTAAETTAITETEPEESEASEEIVETTESSEPAPSRKPYEPTPEPTVTPGLVREESYYVQEGKDDDLVLVKEYEDGKIVKEDNKQDGVVKEYFYDGDQKVSETVNGYDFIVNYTYEDDKLVHSEHFNKDGELVNEVNWTYEGDWLIETDYVSNDDRSMYKHTNTVVTYDELGYPIRETLTREYDNGKSITVTENTYDDNGLLVYFIVWDCDEDGNRTDKYRETTITYDDEDREISWVRREDGSKKISLQIDTLYDEDGNILKVEKTSVTNPNLNSTTFYSYKKDDQGRVTEMLKYDELSQLKTFYFYE